MQVSDASSLLHASRMKREFNSPGDDHNVKEPEKGELEDSVIEYCTCKRNTTISYCEQQRSYVLIDK